MRLHRAEAPLHHLCKLAGARADLDGGREILGGVGHARRFTSPRSGVGLGCDC